MADTKAEVKLWLETALAKENLKNISVDILGNSEKGDGFMSDIVFVNATGIDTTTNKEKTLNLVLKCSKKSQVLRDTVPVQDTFLREIFVYDEILPEFQKFQRSKSVQNVFDSFPKYYGHFANENTEIIVFENLKKIGYELWNHRIPVTKNHLLMVLEKYGQYHGISAAMRVQNPEKFNYFCDRLEELSKKLAEITALEKMMEGVCAEVENLLKDSWDEEILDRFGRFKNNLFYIFFKMFKECKEDFKIISHGDCWNNNFMWKHSEQDKTVPEKVAILDWQGPILVSPISDLSYFIFSCISKNDLLDFDTLLNTYYNSFSQTLKQLGNNSEDIYPKEQFLSDWQKYSRYGFGFALLVNKLGFAQKEDLPDIEKTAQEGDFDDLYAFSMNDNEGYKRRIEPLVRFAAKNKLLD